MTQGRVKNPRSRRRRHAAAENITCADWLSIISSVCRFLGCDHRSLERRASKKPFASAVGINGGSRCDGSLHIATDRPRRRACIGADRHVPVTRKGAHGPIRVENKNEFGDLRANLRTPARAAGPDKGRPRPAVTGPGDDHALATFAADPKPDFYYRHDREAPGVAQHTSGNASFRHPAKSSQDRGGLVHHFLLGGGLRGDERKEGSDEKSADRFHGTTTSPGRACADVLDDVARPR